MSRNTRSNGAASKAPAANVLVQIQTLRGNAGTDAQFAEVEKAVKAHNSANGKSAPHVAVKVTALDANRKGMQWRLALFATLARVNGVSMIRLGVHNGVVALCGPKDAVANVQDAMVPWTNYYATAVANTYSQAVHGNKVGFENGYLCGCPAGLQIAANVAPTLAYGLGFLFSFPAPGDGKAYGIGQTAAYTAGTSAVVVATKTAGKPNTRTAAPRKIRPTQLPATTTATDATDATDATTTDAPTTDTANAA